MEEVFVLSLSLVYSLELFIEPRAKCTSANPADYSLVISSHASSTQGLFQNARRARRPTALRSPLLFYSTPSLVRLLRVTVLVIMTRCQMLGDKVIVSEDDISTEYIRHFLKLSPSSD